MCTARARPNSCATGWIVYSMLNVAHNQLSSQPHSTGCRLVLPGAAPTRTCVGDGAVRARRMRHRPHPSAPTAAIAPGCTTGSRTCAGAGGVNLRTHPTAPAALGDMDPEEHGRVHTTMRHSHRMDSGQAVGAHLGLPGGGELAHVQDTRQRRRGRRLRRHARPCQEDTTGCWFGMRCRPNE